MQLRRIRCDKWPQTTNFSTNTHICCDKNCRKYLFLRIWRPQLAGLQVKTPDIHQAASL